MAAIVICPVNRKGGVGKSSSVFHLGGYFASQDFRVLLIDNEPQHSLTNGLIGPHAASALPLEQTTAALFATPDTANPETLIRETQFDSIRLVCGSDALDQFNGPIEQHSVETQLALKRFVDRVADQFDVILIDNPPNLQLCTYSSLAAANIAYCISKPQEYDVQGMVPVQHAIDRVLRTTNPTLRFAGYVLNMVQAKRSLHKAYENLLRETYGVKVLKTTVPDWNDYAESLTARSPVSLYRPRSPAAKIIENLALELSERIATLYKQPPEFQSNTAYSRKETIA